MPQPNLPANLSQPGADDMPAVPLGRDFPEIRDAVAAICKRYPGAYWRDLEDRREYPHEFVKELGEAGYLAALIPQEYGGAGLPLRAGGVILEEIHANGCMASHCHAQMYMMEMLLRHGSTEQKQHYLGEMAKGVATSFALSEKFTKQFKDFWNLPADWQLREEELGVPSYGARHRMDLSLLPDVKTVVQVEE